MSIEDATPPEVLIAAALGEGTGQSIESAEAAGQHTLMNSTAIPVAGYRDTDMEAIGVRLGAVHDDDPLFRDCTLPDGWSRDSMGDPRGAYIRDQHGRARVEIFYKAAWYDRKADAQIIAVPLTRPQQDSYDAVTRDYPDPGWGLPARRLEGENLVWMIPEQSPDDAGGRKTTGRVRERVVAPDGTVLGNRDAGATS